jgi:hypothetical protein
VIYSAAGSPHASGWQGRGDRPSARSLGLPAPSWTISKRNDREHRAIRAMIASGTGAGARTLARQLRPRLLELFTDVPRSCGDPLQVPDGGLPTLGSQSCGEFRESCLGRAELRGPGGCDVVGIASSNSYSGGRTKAIAEMVKLTVQTVEQEQIVDEASREHQRPDTARWSHCNRRRRRSATQTGFLPPSFSRVAFIEA